MLFLVVERRAPEPILPLRIFTIPTVAVAGAVTLIRAVAIYSLIIYVPLLVQGVMGGSSEDARNAVTIFSLPGVLGAVLAGFLVGRGTRYRTLMFGGLALTAAGLWLVTRSNMVAGSTELLFDLGLSGFGVGVTQVTIILALQNSVAKEQMGTASSLAQFLSNLAGTVGVGLLSTYQADLLAQGVRPILDSPLMSRLSPPAAQALADPANLGRVLTSPVAGAQFPAELVAVFRGALETSLHGVFQVGLVLVVIALAFSVFMQGSAAGSASREVRPGTAAEPGETEA